MKQLKISEMVVEQLKDEIRTLENTKKAKIKEFIEDLKTAFNFKEYDVLSNGNDGVHKELIIVAVFKVGYIPTWIYSDVSNKDLDAEGIRKYGLHALYYTVNKNNTRNKVTNYHYNKTFVEDWVKVGEYNCETDVITFTKET